MLGAGGMGEVYRAQDTKLNRQVAIKVLPEAHAADAERVARFRREAQAVAALNHPRIAAIYDFAETGNTRYLVLELVEGDTLAERIRRGAVPIDEAIGVAIQILDALEAAHEKGICHRDLKPANIKLTPDGTIKVLDFGLARFLEINPAAPNLSQSPTLSVAGTLPGVILGTAGYMSPEQAKGYQADHRSDIFSFGCIFYELLTGRQAFDGETVSEILAGVLKIEVDLTTLPPRLNPRLIEMLRRCLEKNPKKRWHAAADVRVELEAIAGRAMVVDDAPVSAPVAPRAWWRRALPWAAGLLLGGAAAGSAAWVLKPQPERTVTRFVIPLPEDQRFANTGGHLVAVSPDGSNLVYVANNRLYLRPMADLEPRVISGSESTGAILNPVFSPDGQTLAFYSVADRALKRLAVSGGAAATISPADRPTGLSWDEHGVVFGQGPKGILRVSPNGGTPEVLATVATDERASLPQLLPSGEAVLFSVKKNAVDNWDAGKIVVQVLGGERKTLVEGGADGRYLPTGHLVFARAASLLAVPLDLASLSVVGGAVPVVEGVRRAGSIGLSGMGGAHFSYSSNGTMVYLPGGPILTTPDTFDLAVFDRKGVARPLGLKPGAYRSPRVSPDGRFVAFDLENDKESSVWVYELSGGRALQRLTFDGNNRHPMWSRDGRWVAFQSDRDGDRAIFRQLADGSGAAERLTKPEAGAEHIPQSWSPGDGHLLFSVVKDQQWTLWTMTLKDRQPAAFGDVRSIDLVEGEFSPDGRWIAYQAHERSDVPRMVFVQPFPSTGAKYLARQEGGGHPYWSAKGDELILNAGPSSSVRIPFAAAPRVAFGQPIDFPRVGRVELNPRFSRRNVDSLPDGAHVIGVYTDGVPDVEDPRQIRVVLNWFDEVRQRAR